MSMFYHTFIVSNRSLAVQSPANLVWCCITDSKTGSQIYAGTRTPGQFIICNDNEVTQTAKSLSTHFNGITHHDITVQVRNTQLTALIDRV